MAALDFPNSPTVGQQYNAPNSVAYTWDGATWTLAGPAPSGVAGGALTGTYPNPGVDYSKVTGTPAALPPNGVAGGDLTGTYPNPQVAPAAKSKWVVAGSAITPVDATKTVASTPLEALRVGSRTAKGRLVSATVRETLHLTENATLNVAENAWVRDDPSKPAWQVSLDALGDQFIVGHLDAGGTYTAPFVVEAGRTVTASDLTVGAAGAPKINLGLRCALEAWDGGIITLYANDPATIGYNAALLGWKLMFDYRAGGAISAHYRPAGGASTQTLWHDTAGNFVIAGAIGQKSTGTTWANPSDDRIKKDVVPYATGLAAVLALDPIAFKFNGQGGSKDGMPGLGFSAQAVQSIMPEMVSSRRATVNDAETDLLILDTTALPLALVNAVKELAARVATLEAR